MPLRARAIVDPEFQVGTVDPRLYSSFIEHCGRIIYGGIYEPDHPDADDRGFRRDVLDMVSEARIPLYRYPGGWYASQYRWEDLVGPKAERPVRLSYHGRELDPTEFGLDDAVEWASRAGAGLLAVVNIGTRDLLSAADMVEYCNHPGGTYLSDLRVSHGAVQPYGIKMWGLDNELDAEWEMGRMTPDHYGRRCYEAAKIMRRVDPEIEIVAVGSTAPDLPSFPDWNRVVLEHAYGAVDYIAPHIYLRKISNDGRERSTAEFLASTVAFDDYLSVVGATLDYAKAKARSLRDIYICLDEWNVWYHTGLGSEIDGVAELTPAERNAHPTLLEQSCGYSPWTVGPRLTEDIYTHEDALVVGLMLITMLKHARRVKVACLSTVVNCLGAIMTEPGGAAWRQTIWYPFMHASCYGHGVVLDVLVNSPKYESKEFGPIAVIDAVATLDEDHRSLTLFAVNRSCDELVEFTADLRLHQACDVVEHVVMSCSEACRANTATSPHAVVPHARGDATIGAGVLSASLDPLSWNVIRLKWDGGPAGGARRPAGMRA